MSAVAAHWDRVKKAVEIRNSLGSKTLIVGNGDVKDIEDAKQKAKETGADGIMLGRAIFGKPWLFRGPSADPVAEPVDVRGSVEGPETRLRILIEHTKLFEELLGDIKSFAIMKKHFKAYVEGFDGAKELRVQLMEAQNADEVESIVETFLEAR